MLYWNDQYKKKIILPQNWVKTSKDLKNAGRSIVTLNGSFDLLHAGHMQILFEASQQGDVLIVALNSDHSIKTYKSFNRPIISLDNRLKLIAALEFVDFITWFDETDPICFLEAIKPHIHVNGAEYGENCIESNTVKKYGGKVYLVNRLPELSTSEIIEKIKKL